MHKHFFLSEVCLSHALVAPCTSKSPFEVCFRHALVARCWRVLQTCAWWQNAQARFRLKSVSDTRLWRGAQTVLVCTVVQICTCGEMHKQVPVWWGFQTCACGNRHNHFLSEECCRLALVARCTNLFLSEECFRHALVVIAQAGFRWSRARLVQQNLWAFQAPTLVPCTLFSAISASVSRGTFTTTLVGHFEDQLEYVRKTAGARQHLSDDTDVDQCRPSVCPLLKMFSCVAFPRLRKTWSCFTHRLRSVCVCVTVLSQLHTSATATNGK